MKILFCNIGWMDNYNGADVEKPKRGGSFNEHSIGHEVCNFSNVNGKVFGYVRSKGEININKLGAKKDQKYIDGVTVVWLAGPDAGGTAVIGWYKNARVYRRPQDLNFSKIHKKNKINFYLIEAKYDDTYLVPVSDRSLLIPRAKKGGIGQSNVWYAQAPEAHQYVQQVIKYINGDNNYNIDIDEYFANKEGQPRFKKHLIRERDPTLIDRKKQKILKEKGKLQCEVCEFDFESFYGVIGKHFCEVHHLIPLYQADGLIETKLDDLAIVCSNCHRMIHKKDPIFTIDELKKLLKK